LRDETMVKFDLRVVQLIAAVLIAFALVVPLIPPVGIGKWTQDFYNTIEGLPEGSYVLMQTGWDGSLDTRDAFIAVWRHCILKHHKVIFWATKADQIPLEEELWVMHILGSSPDKWPLYGKEMVYLGLIEAPGAMYLMKEDITAIVKTDYYGNSLTNYDKLPMMKGLTGIKDVDAIIGWIQTEWVYLFPDTNLLSCVWTGEFGAYNMAHYVAGITKGGVFGLRGGAEYEILMGKPAGASHLLLAATLLGGWTIIVIILGSAYSVYSTYLKPRSVK